MVKQIKHSVNSTPGFGLSCKVLILKGVENVLYTAREGGTGLAHSGLLAGSSNSCTPEVLTECPMF